MKDTSTVIHRTAKLIMVTPSNNNKFYEMQENGDGTMTVTYGRVGSRGTIKKYPASQWRRRYNEKVRKGYKDQTHLFAVVKNDEPQLELVDVDDELVQRLITELMAYATKSISKNYMVSANQVTKLQVEEAQTLLDNLVTQLKTGLWVDGNNRKTGVNTKRFNGVLLELYQVIPRKMTKVGDHLIERPSSEDDLEKIKEKLVEEQATLDVMRGQVKVTSLETENKVEKKQLNLLEAMGLQIESVTDDETIKVIKSKMGPNANQFSKAFAVKNLKTQKGFDDWIGEKKNQEKQLFWHGSRNENWLSILETGLVLRPANAVVTGKMFGYGTYFADKFKKSLNYTSLRGSYWTKGTQSKGFLALFDVHTGNQFHIQKHQSWCYELNETNLKKKGEHYDSLFAEGGADLVNNEYIVYNEKQCTVRYLVEVV
ncbi:MAG: WGR domain-containing protein [Chitinophagales bacterium]